MFYIISGNNYGKIMFKTTAILHYFVFCYRKEINCFVHFILVTFLCVFWSSSVCLLFKSTHFARQDGSDRNKYKKINKVNKVNTS